MEDRLDNQDSFNELERVVEQLIEGYTRLRQDNRALRVELERLGEENRKLDSTRKSLENAARIVACTGGSTNAGLHLPAIAHEAGIDFDLMDVCEIFRDTPYFVDLKPGGQRGAGQQGKSSGVSIHRQPP